MQTIKIIYISIFSLVVASGCSFNSNITEFKKPTGVLKCAKPPLDVIATGIQANVEALIPKIELDVKANASASNTVARIRTEIPNLQAIEALDYRMCMQYGNKAIDSKTYKEFMNKILPMLNGVKAQGSTGNQTINIEERRHYSGVSRCNSERSKRTATASCNEGGLAYASRNQLQLVSSRLISFTHDVDNDREPWPSNARSCEADVIANCEIIVKENGS